jgi:hypothetical protein
MATLLTWDPRRLRVLLAKLGAAGALTFMLAVGLQLLLGAALLPAGLLRGTTEGIDADWVRSLSGVDLRVAAISVLGTMMGLSLATIGRKTAAALGVAFGYFAIVENAIRGLRPRLDALAAWRQPHGGHHQPAAELPPRRPLHRERRDPARLLHAGVAGFGRDHLPSARHHLTSHPENRTGAAPQQAGRRRTAPQQPILADRPSLLGRQTARRLSRASRAARISRITPPGSIAVSIGGSCPARSRSNRPVDELSQATP